jgi:hypothetical protein
MVVCVYLTFHNRLTSFASVICSRVTASVSTSVDTPWRTSAGAGTGTGTGSRGLAVTTSTDSLHSASTPTPNSRIGTPAASHIAPRLPGISISTSTTSLSPFQFPSESAQATAAAAIPPAQQRVGPAIDPSLLAYVDRKLGGASSEIDALDMFEARIAARRQLQLSQSRDYGLEGEMSSLAAEIAQRLQVQMQQEQLSEVRSG